MGRMSFPENEDKPSRTITATKIGTSREAIIYLSESGRKGNGEFRTPTVREAACIMGFPITFQFLGGETTKWRLVGNAVCPCVARAFAKQVRVKLGLRGYAKLFLISEPHLENIGNLNSYSQKVFNKPPIRNKGSRFRRHPFKDGNITVTLSNYDIDKNGTNTHKWRTSIQYGNGEGFPTFSLADGFYKKIEKIIRKELQGSSFLEIVNNGFSAKIAKGQLLQEMYEIQKPREIYLEPTTLVEKIAEIINGLKIENEKFEQEKTIIFKNKVTVPLKQLFALYAINKIATIANG
jgi:DNA (cytosine-5)-methyltransferase 1